MRSAAPLPGWFGKLPGIGDFAHRRLPTEFRTHWDGWLQGGLQRLRERHDDWVTHYLEGPVWFFLLGEQVIGPRAWIGVLMPSVDSVGRYFPFMLAAELTSVCGVAGPDHQAALQRWWVSAARAALTGLEQDLDAQRFDALLASSFGCNAPPQAASPEDGTAPAAVALPLVGQSHWFTDTHSAAGLRMQLGGLPQAPHFDSLFGFAESGFQELM